MLTGRNWSVDCWRDSSPPWIAVSVGHPTINWQEAKLLAEALLMKAEEARRIEQANEDANRRRED